MAFYLGLIYENVGVTDPQRVNLSDYIMFYSPTEGVDRVTEQFVIRLPAGLTNARDTLRDLRNHFRRARETTQSAGVPRVWVEFLPLDTEDVYRAQLFDGALQPSDTILTKGQLTAAYFDYTITWTREAIWSDNSTDAAVQSTTTPLGMAYHDVSGAWRLYNSADQTQVTDEVLAAGDGATTSFSGTTANPLIYRSRSEPVFSYTIGASVKTYSYDALKATSSATTKVTSVTLNFATGAWALTFSDPPDNLTNITLTYKYGYGNWLQIDGESGPTLSLYPYTLTGDTPGAAFLTLTNKAAAVNLDEMWIGCYIAPDDESYPKLWYEAEDAGSIETSGAIQGDAQDSGGAEVAWTVTTSETVLLDWTLAAADVRLMAGKWFAPIVRYGDTNKSNIPSVLLRWQVYTDSGGTRAALIFETDQYQPADNGKILHQLGMLQLPPQFVGLFTSVDASIRSPGPIHLVLTGYSPGTSRALSIDAVQLMPTDFFTKIEYRGEIPPDEIIRVNSYDKYGEHETATPYYIRTPTVLHDWPVIDTNRDQRWYFLWTDATDDQTDFAWPLAVSLAYFPRRGSI